MNIRRAKKEDTSAILDLLDQVNRIHHEARGDLFRRGTKYTAEELQTIIADDSRPILVAEEDGTVKGYAFCVMEEQPENSVLNAVKTLYVDDICVDEKERGKHIGKSLYGAVQALAKERGCYHITLNVWCFNESAMRFYEACGMRPLKIYMEQTKEDF